MRNVIAVSVLAILTPFGVPEVAGQDKTAGTPRVVGHRGLMRHAPENTLSGFAACIQLRLGFELDIRRTKDGVLVCLHDDDVGRTTDAKGKVADMTLADIRKLDAGRWFARDFKGEKVPTLDEVFALLKAAGNPDILVALDIKIEDETLEGDIVALAKKHGVLSQVMCIGRAITEPELRKKLHTADAKTPIAVLADKADDLAMALAAKEATWIYVRFVPSAAQVKSIHDQGKRLFLVGKLVAGNEPDNWRRAQEVGVDAILTDFPLECQQVWRTAKTK